MELMNAHGIATPRGYLASTPVEAEIIYQTEFAKRECVENEVVCRLQALTNLWEAS